MSTFFRKDGNVQNAVGYAMAGVEVYVVTQPADTAVFPPTPLATIYQDSIGTPTANPGFVVTNGQGDFFFYAAAGIYTIVYFDPFGRIPNQVFPDQEIQAPTGGGGGGGTVTSVGLSGDGTVFDSPVSGSPITTSGTLGPMTLLAHSQNTFLAGPSSGGAATPTWRKLTLSDLPAGVGSGTVTSVAMTGDGTIFNTAVSGSPITGAGTLAPTLVTQSANAVLCGPTAGGPAVPTFRKLTLADLPSGIGNVGTVTSVGFTGDGVIFNASIAGSPITGAGTLVPSLIAQGANTVLAGPSSGGNATPTFRKLTIADLPGGVGSGSVTSVGVSVTPGTLLTASVAGTPVTTAGTIAITLGVANQAANTFLAGPTSGGVGAVTARTMVPADLPPAQTVAFSATPTFNGALGTSFFITLTGNVTSSTFSNGVKGQLYTFVISQDGVGGRTFVWPTNVKQPGVPDPTISIVNTQTFIFDGTNLRPIADMIAAL